MKCLIIDDEASARARLARMLAAHASVLEIAGEASNGIEALETINSIAPDLLFLDIEMPGINGFQVLQSLPGNATPPMVIFVTGYDQHALAAFEANALAYLLKPVEAERLAHVVDRAFRLHNFQPQREQDARATSDFVESRSGTVFRQIVGRKRDRYFLLSPDEIVFFRADDGLVRAHTANDSYWVNHQLNQLEAGLPAERFFRAHRSVIVNLDCVREIRASFKSSFLLLMQDASQTEVQVSERQAPLLRKRIPGL